MKQVPGIFHCQDRDASGSCAESASSYSLDFHLVALNIVPAHRLIHCAAFLLGQCVESELNGSSGEVVEISTL